MPGGLLWGWYDTLHKWVKLQVDENGFVKVDMSAINLDDLADVRVPAPGDQNFLYWDDVAGEWTYRILVDADIPAGIARDAEVDAKIAAHHDTIIKDADEDTKVDVEEAADEDKIHMDVKGVEAFLLHDDGILDLAKQSGCHAYLSSAYDAPDGWGKVPLDAVDYDIQSEFNTVTSKWIAKQTGTYVVALRCATDIGVTVPDGTKNYVRVWINGAVGPISAAFMVSAVDVASASFAFVYRFTIGDEVEMYFSQNSGAAKAMGTGFQATFMEIAKIA